MPAKRVTRVGALLLVMVVTGLAAVNAAPTDGQVIGIWPVGLASAALVVAGGRRPWLPLLPVVLAAALLSIAMARPLEVAVGYALTITLETWLVWWLLTRGGAVEPSLRDDRRLGRLVAASGAGAGVAAGGGALTSVATGFGDPGLIALGLGTAHLSSQLVLLPLVALMPEQRPLAGRGERALQWVAIAVAAPLVFWPTDFPSLIFLLIPLLAWGALRDAPREAMGQVLLMAGVAIVATTYGRGPFTDVPEQYGLPPDSRGILLAAFAAACALVVVPLLVSAGMQVAAARDAAAQRDKVQRIVAGARGVAVIVTDELGRVTLFNAGAERLLGWTEAEVLGRPTTIFHAPHQLADAARRLGISWSPTSGFVEVVRRMLERGEPGFRLGFVRRDGTERVHSVTLSRLVDDRGQALGYVSTSEDVTDQLEERRALEEALATERQAVERLREVDTVKDAFVSSVSHELRTPITSIHGYLELLQDGAYGELTGPQLDAVRRVEANSTRLLSLINDLLTLSRIQEDGLGLELDRFDLVEAVRAGCAVVAPMWGVRALEVSMELPEGPVPFVGDRDMVERAVVNLVSNAVKFTRDGGRVTVRLRVQGAEPSAGEGAAMAVLDVSDTGIGIPEDEQGRLFTRFFRSSLAQREAIPGSGLGLSITRAIVEKHGGEMAVRSQVGSGTTFSVRVPVATG